MSLTFRDLLKRGCERLSEAHISNASQDAKLLLLAAAKFKASDYILNEDEFAPGPVIRQFDEFLQKRILRHPVSLILGQVYFFGLTFKTDQRALAPRQDSELLVERALVEVDGIPAGRILDLGTGSGCLALSFLANKTNWTGDAVDKSDEALSLAEENAEALVLSDRISFHHCDWSGAAGLISEADLLISNPPYIRTDVLSGLEPEVLNHDPDMALDGGLDGLDAYRSILDLATQYGRSGLKILFEIGYDQADDLKGLCLEKKLTDFAVWKDFSGHNRVVRVILL